MSFKREIQPYPDRTQLGEGGQNDLHIRWHAQAEIHYAVQADMLLGE